MSDSPTPGPWRATASALCASLVGIGVARFGYSPLVPAVIAAGWFGPGEAAYLGAANLAGYLAGALVGRRAAAGTRPAVALRAMMLMVAASFLACAQPAPFAWFLGWRFLSGLAGGVIMVLAAPLVLPHVPAGRRGVAGGLIFTGVGIGVAASGTLVPRLLPLGLGPTWMALAALCLALTLASWGGWPDDAPLPATSAGPNPHVFHRPYTFALLALLVVYALDAVGIVPHMVFLVDYAARGLGLGIETGALLWVVFGLGAAVGPVSLGHFGDRIGFGALLRLSLAIQVAAVGLAALSANVYCLALSGFVIGAFTPGIVPVVLGRVRELIPDDLAAQRTAWSLVTIAFAGGQASGAYGLSAIFATTGFEPLYRIGAAAMAAALMLDLVTAPKEAAR